MIDIRCKVCDKKTNIKAVIFIGVIRCRSCKMLSEYNIQSNQLQVTDRYDTLKPESQRPNPV